MPVVARLKGFFKPLIDATIEQLAQMFRALDGQGVPPAIYGLLRKYGYGDLVARAQISGSDAKPPLLKRIEMVDGKTRDKRRV